MRIPHAPVRLEPKRLLQGALLFCLGLGVAFCEHVATAEDESAGPSSAEVRQALAVFAKASKSKDPVERATAVRTLGAVRHEKVAARLLKFAKREPHATVLAATFEALGGQRTAAKKVVKALRRRLEVETSAEAQRIRRGTPSFRVDPRTGDPDLQSAEGLAHLEATKQRAAMVLALLRALEALDGTADADFPDLAPFLQDPADDLVVAVLQHVGRREAWPALPAMSDLFRMYPAAALWETSAVEHAGGTDATAKAAWLARFGHPDKQRARPKVHAALVAALKAITGETFDAPEALAAYLQRPEIQARVEGRRAKR